MIPTTQPTYAQISIDAIHAHIDHARPLYPGSEKDQWLLDSVETSGILVPLAVMEEEPGLYRIIDGHRRYFAACQLGMKTVPCLVRPKLSRGEYEVLRYRFQNTYKPLTQAERNKAAKRLSECDDEES
jgi:ParB/RepB/Spo0J family partition protein